MKITPSPSPPFGSVSPVAVPSASYATGAVTGGEIMEFEVVAVPEPASLSAALAGLLSLADTQRFRRRRA